MYPGLDGLTWFDGLTWLILGKPVIFFFYLVIKLLLHDLIARPTSNILGSGVTGSCKFNFIINIINITLRSDVAATQDSWV